VYRPSDSQQLNVVSYKDRKEFAADLKPVYAATTEDEAVIALQSFEAKWGKRAIHR